MNLLAIDTSTDYLVIALTKDEKVVARMHKRTDRMHSSLLVPMIGELVSSAGLKPKDLDGFIVGIGPGSFTGLRIGVTTIKGLAYVLKKPIVAVPTFDVIARNAKTFKGIVCPVLDARKNKVYACLYASDGSSAKRISKYLLLSVTDLMEKVKRYDKIFFLGDGVPLLPRMADSICKDWHPRADILARLGIENFRKRKFQSPENLEPMYLYSKECDIKGR